MNYHVLGKGLTVSTVGLSCMGMSHAYGAPSDRPREKLGTANVTLAVDEVAAIDATLDGIEMSRVFGGSQMVNK